MKTTESFTREDLGKIIVNIAMSRLDRWAAAEVNYLRYALNRPVVIPLSDKHWVIGNFNIKNIGQHRYTVIEESRTVHVFYSKQAAVLYAALTKVKNYKLADLILNEDQVAAKLYDELEFYTKKLQNKPGNDSFKYQLWQTRYNETKFKFAAARQELAKTLESAKYSKIWDNIL